VRRRTEVFQVEVSFEVEEVLHLWHLLRTTVGLLYVKHVHLKVKWHMVLGMHLVQSRSRVVAIVRSEVAGDELDSDGFVRAQAPDDIEGLCVDVAE